MKFRSTKRQFRKVILQGCLLGRKGGENRPPPDFVIVGAQRCGTTSLFRALSEHPAMMPNIINAKGIHYFGTNYHRKDSWYFSHFASQSERDQHSEKINQKAIVGESSPYYLFHPAVAERMATTIPLTKIIILLRDPVKRAISHYLHMVWEGHEPIKDIDTALELEQTRLKGLEQRLQDDATFTSRHHQHFSYVARGKYAEQVERFFLHFSKENILVMPIETLISDSASSLSKIQSFLGLESHPSVVLEKRNASSRYTPNARTIVRLKNEFKESNERLSRIIDIDAPWIRDS